MHNVSGKIIPDEGMGEKKVEFNFQDLDTVKVFAVSWGRFYKFLLASLGKSEPSNCAKG